MPLLDSPLLNNHTGGGCCSAAPIGMKLSSLGVGHAAWLGRRPPLASRPTSAQIAVPALGVLRTLAPQHRRSLQPLRSARKLLALLDATARAHTAQHPSDGCLQASFPQGDHQSIGLAHALPALL